MVDLAEKLWPFTRYHGVKINGIITWPSPYAYTSCLSCS